MRGPGAQSAIMLILVALLAACGPAAPPARTVLPTGMPAPPTETAAPLPTDTVAPPPSRTPKPTYTPAPTSTPYETITGQSYVEGDSVRTLSLYLPAAAYRKPLALLVASGEYFPELVKHFARLGYPVIGFNMRDDSYLTEIQDAFCALAWAHANANTYGFDAGRIVPVGGSMWGGNAALLGLVDDPTPFLEECPYALPETGRVRAVITLAGVFDYSEEGDFFAGFIEKIGDFMGGTPSQAPENWATASAITWVEENEPPFLLIHGEADTNVAPHQSEKFAAALEEAGADVELVLIPGVNHNTSVSDPRVFQAMQSFLEQLTDDSAQDGDPGGRPEPTPAPPLQGPAAEIDTYLRSLEEEGAFSGAVLVAREGQVLLSKGYGLANREEDVPNTPQTRLRLCSITKQFTAMGILLLQNQGALDVQDHLCDYMADCPSAWAEITLHQLLVHTSGIPDFTELPGYEATKSSPATPLEIIGRFRTLPLDFPPGQEWRYSNSGYILLGYIIEQVSGRPYDAFIQERIFQPLGMADSGYDHNLDDIATGYTGEEGRWRKTGYIDMSIPYSAGALYSTVEDMLRWDQALYTEQLVPRALLEQMFTPFAESPLGGYGYGWFITRKHNRPVIRHGGGGDGFITLIERYPDDRVTIIALCNRETADLGTIVTRIGQEVFRQ